MSTTKWQVKAFDDSQTDSESDVEAIEDQQLVSNHSPPPEPESPAEVIKPARRSERIKSISANKKNDDRLDADARPAKQKAKTSTNGSASASNNGGGGRSGVGVGHQTDNNNNIELIELTMNQHSNVGKKRKHNGSVKSSLAEAYLKYFVDFVEPSVLPATESLINDPISDDIGSNSDPLIRNAVDNLSHPSAKCTICGKRRQYKKGDYWNLKTHMEKV